MANGASYAVTGGAICGAKPNVICGATLNAKHAAKPSVICANHYIYNARVTVLYIPIVYAVRLSKGGKGYLQSGRGGGKTFGKAKGMCP